MAGKRVIVYTSYGCAVCNQVKAFLKQKGVSFIERNIVEDEEAYREIERLGLMTTPAVVINGEVVTGFNRRRIEELLAS